jgi:hypothetical protein
MGYFIKTRRWALLTDTDDDCDSGCTYMLFPVVITCLGLLRLCLCGNIPMIPVQHEASSDGGSATSE